MNPNFVPALALLCNALIWGLSWWPLRLMFDAGLHPLWATALMFALIATAMLLLRPAARQRLLRTPGLWLLMLTAGMTNVAFNWAITIGDVVRVVLLFYLMPAWAVLLAWRFLGERPSGWALARLAPVVFLIWFAAGAISRGNAAVGGEGGLLGLIGL